MVNNPSAVQETWVQYLGQENPLEKGMATYFSILALRIPWAEEPGRLQSMQSQRVRHNWATKHKHEVQRNSERLFDWSKITQFSSVQFSSVAQSCPTLCDPMDRSMPGLPVHHQFLEFTQTHVHGVSDAIQPSHPLSSPSPPAPNPSQHHSLFQWVNSSHDVAKVLEFQL